MEPKEHWRQVELGSVCRLPERQVKPVEFQEYENYVGLEDIESGTGRIVEYKKVKNAGLKSSKFPFDPSCILYGKLRPYLNKVAIPTVKGICSTDILPLRPNLTLVLKDFLYFYLRSPYFIKTASEKSTGANLPRLAPNVLLKIPVPLPTIGTQRMIANILLKADQLIQRRVRANKLTSKIIQSVFLKMFGDPIRNDKWIVRALAELALDKHSIRCGPFGSQLKIGEYVNEGIPVLGIDNVKVDRFVWAKPKAITPEKFLILRPFSVRPSDVLITRTGTVGRTCVVPASIGKAVIGPNLLKVTFNEKAMLPEFFAAALSYFPSMTNEVRSLSPGATVAVFNTHNLKSLKIIAPPLELQQSFVRRKSVVQRLVATQSRSQEDIEATFHSLMHKAFGGELRNAS